VIRYGVYPALDGVMQRTECVFAGEDDLYINGAMTTRDIGFKRIPTKYLAVYFRASTPEAGKTLNLLPEFTPEIHTSKEKELRKRMCAMIRRAYDHRLVTSMGGTFSVRVSEDEFLVTPNGLDRKYLEEGDLILIRNGEREEGKIPSRSVWLHRKIYQKHPGVHSIIIAHPPNVMAFAVSGTLFDARTIPESYYVLRDIPALAFGAQFAATETVSETLSDKVPVVLVENECIIITGGELLQAFDRLEVAEFSANAIIQAKAMGPVRAITEDQVAELHRAFRF
jgi:L-fuculose-phosphate aldolase